MVTVFIPAPLRELTGGLVQVQIQAATVREVVEQLEKQFSGIQARLCDDDQLAPSLRVSVGNAVSLEGLSSKTPAGSEVRFLPAIAGG